MADDLGFLGPKAWFGGKGESEKGTDGDKGLHDIPDQPEGALRAFRVTNDLVSPSRLRTCSAEGEDPVNGP